MPFQLGDIYIGNFSITQDFGANPAVYSARYPGLKGHNGQDWACPTMTPILAAADGVVSFVGDVAHNTFDTGGFGNYIKLHHDGYLTLYGHLNDITINLGDHVVAGQLIGHSNNTGWSSGPHLHFGVAPCDGNGNKTEPNNGYSGYIDPNGELCHWDVKNLTAPINPHEQVQPTVSVSPDEMSIKSVQANNFQSIVQFGLNNGFGVYLTNNGQSIDLKNNPVDTDGARKVNSWIATLLTQLETLKNTTPLVDTAQLTDQQKTGLVQAVTGWIKNFIFLKA